MLTKFAVKNYRGFSEKIEWDLTDIKNYSFNSFAIKDGIIKNGIIYGPNGAGKSNFALALFDITLHLTQKVKHPNQIDYIVNAYHSKDLVEFEYTFKFDNKTIFYSYSKGFNGLEKESVIVDEKLLFKLENNKLTIDDDTFPMQESLKIQLANSSNKVSVLGYLTGFYPMNSEHPLMRLKDFVDGMLMFWNLENRGFVGFQQHEEPNIEEYIIKNKLTADFSDFLKSVSELDFNFKTNNANNKLLICEMGVYIPFYKIRSTGTSSLTLLYYWIHKMKTASFVMIDEFDAFYHFDLSFKVCQRLFSLSNQIFVTSHNTYLMTNDLLRPDCNFIINHNKIKPLCACTNKELRFGNSIEKMYRGNAFEV